MADPISTIQTRLSLGEKGELIYGRACNFIRETYDRIKRRKEFDIKNGLNLVEETIPFSNMDILYSMALKPKGYSDFLVFHAVNVFIFSLKMCRGLNYSMDKTLELGAASLLHDVGIEKISEDIINKDTTLSTTEVETIKNHPQCGYKLIIAQGEPYQNIAKIVLQTHERENGQGYPGRMKGKEIDESAKIIGICDIFEALTHARPYRQSLSPYDAVKEIMNIEKTAFPSNILKVLIQKMSVFPLFSTVRLNSGFAGEVIATSEQYPLKPTVKLLYDAKGKKLDDGEVVNLRDAPLLHIVAPLNDEELEELNK